MNSFLEVITNTEKNCLDATCAGRKCKVSTDGLKVDFTGTGIVLAKEGFKKGVHHWEVVVHFIECESYLGISLKPPQNLDGALYQQTTGFCVIGTQSDDNDGKKACHANQKFESTQCFKQGDHVSFTLDCDHSVLEYFINGIKIKDLTFGGNLAKFKDQLLYPAFSSYYSSQLTITFID